MKITIRRIVDWSVAKEVALATIGKQPSSPLPSEEWKAKMQPDCVWYGCCLEMQPCGFTITRLYQKGQSELLKTDYE